jgi:hypothetical protein
MATFKGKKNKDIALKILPDPTAGFTLLNKGSIEVTSYYEGSYTTVANIEKKVAYVTDDSAYTTTTDAEVSSKESSTWFTPTVSPSENLAPNVALTVLSSQFTLTVTINITSVNALDVGTHEDTIIISGTNPDIQEDIEIPISIIILELPDPVLKVTPEEALLKFPDCIESFTDTVSTDPMTVYVESIGIAAAHDMDVTVSADEAWVSLSESTFTLSPGSFKTFEVTVDPNIVLELPDVYKAIITVASLDEGGNTDSVEVPVEIIVNARPQAVLTVISEPIRYIGVENDPGSFFAVPTTEFTIKNSTTQYGHDLVGTISTVDTDVILFDSTFNISAENEETFNSSIDTNSLATNPEGTILNYTIQIASGLTIVYIPVDVLVVGPQPPSVINSDIELVDNYSRYSEITQHIMNLFPDWHVGRRQRDSLVHRIVDATAGRVLQEFDDFELTNFTTQHITTLMDTSPRDKAFILPINQQVVVDDSVPNLVRNSNFNFWSNPAILPDYWSHRVANDADKFILTQFDDTSNFLGGRLMELTSGHRSLVDYQNAHIYQEYEFSTPSSQKDWTLSCFHKTKSGVYAGDIFKLYVSLTYFDESTEIFEQLLPNSSTKFKSSLVFTASKAISKIELGVTWSPLRSPLSVVKLLISNFNLHEGVGSEPWKRNFQDRESNVTEDQTGICVSFNSPNKDRIDLPTKINSNLDVNKRLIANNASIEYFAPDTISDNPPVLAPTRIHPVHHYDKTTVGQALLVSTPIMAAYYNWPAWTIGKIVKFETSHTEEILGTYVLNFPIFDNPDQSHNIGFIQIDALTLYGHKLWVIGRIYNEEEQGTTSANKMLFSKNYTTILACCTMHVPKQPNDTEPDYETTTMGLPVEKMFMFPTQTESLLDNYSMTFEDRNSILIEMQDGYQSRITLRDDYYTYNENNNEIVLLQNPTYTNLGTNIIVC